MDLSIIYVNWNSLNYLRECIASVYEYTHGLTFEIIVVDNASPEGGVDAIKEEFPDVVLIKSEENLGFAGANNVGFKESKGKCILFLNPDMKLLNPAINRMYEQLQLLPDAGIVGCKMYQGNLNVLTNSIMKFPGILNQVFQFEALRLRWPSFPLWDIGPLFSDNPEPVKAEVITGACTMMRREVFEQVGMYSEEYFMYAEDFDLCWNVLRAGFANYYVGTGHMIHYGGVSSPREWQTVMKIRADLRLVSKFRGPFYAFLFRSAMALNAAMRLMVAAVWCLLSKAGPNKEAAIRTRQKYRASLKTYLTPAGSDPRPPNARVNKPLQLTKNERIAH
jgi:GT2 family glycosyltransferase